MPITRRVGQLFWFVLVFVLILSSLLSSSVLGFLVLLVVYLAGALPGGILFATPNAFLNPRLKRGVLGEHTFDITDSGL